MQAVSDFPHLRKRGVKGKGRLPTGADINRVDDNLRAVALALIGRVCAGEIVVDQNLDFPVAVKHVVEAKGDLGFELKADGKTRTTCYPQRTIAGTPRGYELLNAVHRYRRD